MKITKAYYFHTFPNPTTGQWVKIGLEAELTEVDDYRKSLYELKKCVTDFFYESNKAAEKQLQEVRETPKTKEEGFIMSINSATSVKELSLYEPLAKKYPQIQEAYDKKIKELQP